MTADILNRFKRQIASWTLVPSDKGRFEVSLNGKLLYSKLATGRFPDGEEIIGLIQKELTKANR